MVNIYYRNIQLITHILHFFAQPVITSWSHKADVWIVQLRPHFKETGAPLMKPTHLDSFYSLFPFSYFTQYSFNTVRESSFRELTQIKYFFESELLLTSIIVKKSSWEKWGWGRILRNIPNEMMFQTHQ